MRYIQQTNLVKGETKWRKDIADRIRDLRHARDLSLRQLAELSGINHNVIHKWETGKATPNRANVVRLAELFNVKPAWLLFGRDDTTTGLNVQDTFAALSPNSQNQINALINHLLDVESAKAAANEKDS
jgi:transcriptional regulator with XRE-family HTH domain